MTDEVSFLLILLDGVAFAATVTLPVDVPNIVARDVLPVLYEFDRKPLVRAFVDRLTRRPRPTVEPSFNGFGKGQISGLR